MKRILTCLTIALTLSGYLMPLHSQNVGAPELPPEAAIPSQTTVTIRSNATTTGSVNWSALVAMQFPYAAGITTWGAPVRQGNSITLDFFAVKSVVANATPSLISCEANFGALAPGSYTFTVTTRGRNVATKTFTVAPPPPIVQNVAMAVNAANDSNVQAAVHVDFGGYFALTNQSQVTRDANGRFVLEATVDPVAVIQVIPMPPFPKLDLTYHLGAVSPGIYGIVFRMNGKTFKEGSFTVLSGPPPINVQVSATGSTTSTGTNALVRCVFPGALVEVQDVGSPVVLERVATISLKTTVLPTFAPVTEPTVFEKNYPLGVLPAGTYTLVVKIDGLTRGQFPFVVPVINPPPPPPEPRLAFAEAHRDAAGGGHFLDVGIVIPTAGRTITNWGSLVRDGRTFRASTTTGPIIVVEPPVAEEMAGDPLFQGQGFIVAAGANPDGGVVPVQVARHTYPLPILESGEYFLEATVDGKPAGKLSFIIAPLPPPPHAVVGEMTIGKSASGSWFAKVTVILPQPNQIVSDWGNVSANGRALSASIAIGTAELEGGGPPADGAIDGQIVANGGAVLPAPRPVFTHTYDLGLLGEGDYSFALLQGVNQLALRYFRVSATPPPPPPTGPKLAFIEIKQGDVSTAAEVGILLPAGRTVTSWGEVLKEGNAFRVTPTIGASVVAANASALVERHVYSLGALPAGEYKISVCWQDALAAIPPVLLGARTFKVGTPPPPPPGPAPLPIVAFLEAGRDNAGSFVDLGLVFPRPGQEVKDWGTPSREGAAFKTTLTLGPVTTPTPPIEPPTPPVVVADGGVVNVRIGEPLPGANGPAAPVEMGGWPVKPVVHRYALGQIEPGEYSFAVCVGDKVLARRAFWIRPPADVPHPRATVRVEPIRAAKLAPHPFRILFDAPAGWQGDPTLTKVSVTSPNGTVAEAVRVSGGIISMDPLGRLAEGSYTVAAPGDGWDPADNGRYKICVDLSSVLDRQGRTLVESCVGGFAVNIVTSPPPPPPNRKVDIAVAMVDGKWNATVSFENAGGWFQAEWGGVKLEGTSFLARAKLVALPEGSLAPIPVAFQHVYELGELKPGAYLFVFRSSAGHAAVARVDVAGVEPPSPLEQWKFNVLGAAYIDAEQAGDLDDPNGNGVPTLVEFALGGGPAQGAPPDIKPEIIQDNGVPKLALHFHRPAGSQRDVVCKIEVSEDMRRWVPAGDAVELKPSVFDIDGSESICACQKLAIGDSKFPFMRIRVARVGAEE